MNFKLTTAAAAIAAVGFAGSAMAAASDSDTIDVNVEVTEVIVVDVLDSSIDVTTNGLAGLDLAGAGGPAQRAQFDVLANSTFNLLVEVPETWLASNLLPGTTYNQVLYRNGSEFIGGSLFVAPRGSISTPTFFRWSGSAGNISETGLAAGTYEFDLGGEFVPELYGDDSNPGGIVGGVPSPGIYSTTATITASIP